MYAEDLSEKCLVIAGPGSRAVGWLDQEHEFTKGTVPEGMLSRLKEHIASAWHPTKMEIYRCPFCDNVIGSFYVLIPSSKVIYAAPDLVIHYIESHQYRPPDEFLQALVSCPDQGSDGFIGLLRALRKDVWGVIDFDKKVGSESSPRFRKYLDRGHTIVTSRYRDTCVKCGRPGKVRPDPEGGPKPVTLCDKHNREGQPINLIWLGVLLVLIVLGAAGVAVWLVLQEGPK